VTRQKKNRLRSDQNSGPNLTKNPSANPASLPAREARESSTTTRIQPLAKHRNDSPPQFRLKGERENVVTTKRETGDRAYSPARLWVEKRREDRGTTTKTIISSKMGKEG